MTLQQVINKAVGAIINAVCGLGALLQNILPSITKGVQTIISSVNGLLQSAGVDQLFAVVTTALIKVLGVAVTAVTCIVSALSTALCSVLTIVSIIVMALNQIFLGISLLIAALVS